MARVVDMQVTLLIGSSPKSVAGYIRYCLDNADFYGTKMFDPIRGLGSVRSGGVMHRFIHVRTPDSLKGWNKDATKVVVVQPVEDEQTSLLVKEAAGIFGGVEHA